MRSAADVEGVRRPLPTPHVTDRRRLWRTVAAILALAVVLTFFEAMIRPTDWLTTAVSGLFPLFGAPLAWVVGPRLSPMASYQTGRVFLLCGAVSASISMHTWRGTAYGGALSLYMVLTIAFAAVFFTRREVVQLMVIEASLALIVMAVDGLNAEDLLIWGLLTISIGGIGLVMSTSVEAVEVLSYGDPLTGTANRRAWDATCDAMIERSRRSPMDVSVIFVDVDKFKAVNDQFGHDAGDSVLRRGAEAMRKHLRASDTLARIGGDEFAVMMSDSDHQTALVVAERLLEAFHSATGTTISIGVATAPAGRSTDRIVAAADAQLYEAKASGRAMVRGIELADSSPNVSPAGEPSGALTGELHR